MGVERSASGSPGIPTFSPADRGEGVTDFSAEELFRAQARQGNQLGVVVGGKRLSLGRALDLDEMARVGHHEVEVHVGRRVLLVGQIQARLASDHAHR
jgi:hypothetical protein